MFVIMYFLTGFILLIVQKEPEHKSEEEQSVYMLQLLLQFTFWPFFLLWKGVKK